ncbi:MAG: hypothetical protein ACYSWQ_16045 [Planctomycetota bacterium]|jgi:hypothetical protein
MIARNETGQLAEAAFSIALLTEKANECHRKVGHACRSGLMYAKKCGDVLISLRKKFPVHGKMWRQHIEENFEASYKAAKIYMRIARKWDDSRLAGTRRHGLVLKNIKQVLTISKCGPTPDNGHAQDESTSAPTRQDIREGFAKALQQLSSYELDLFATEFNYYWLEIRKMLYRDTCTVLGQDLGEVLSAEMQNMKDWSRMGRWEAVKSPSEEEQQEKEPLRLGMEEQQEKEPLHLGMFEPEHEEPRVRERPNEARNRKKKRAIRLAWQEAAVDVGKRKRALEAAKQRKRKAKPRERLRAGDAKTRRKKRTKRTSVPEKARTKSTGRKTVTKKKKARRKEALHRR